MMGGGQAEAQEARRAVRIGQARLWPAVPRYHAGGDHVHGEASLTDRGKLPRRDA